MSRRPRSNAAKPSASRSAGKDVQPELAVVVLAVKAPGELVEAVRSLVFQTVPLEIVVVSSGGRGAAALLDRERLPVKVIERDELLFPGAARSVGIQATKAPYVAFLASDCLAAPHWAEERIVAHRAGSSAVASAVLNSDPKSVVAWAGHLALFARRMPIVSPEEALAYGASYDRILFERHGLFSETLRIGEDTEFHARLPAADRPVWAPAVQTVHRTPTRLHELLQDQFGRGVRAGVEWGYLRRSSVRAVAKAWRYRAADPMRIAKRMQADPHYRYIRAARFLLPFTSAAYCLGALATRFAMMRAVVARYAPAAIRSVSSGSPPEQGMRE